MSDGKAADNLKIVFQMKNIPDDWEAKDSIYLIGSCNTDFLNKGSVLPDSLCYCGGGKKFKNCHKKLPDTFAHSWVGHKEKFVAVAINAVGKYFVQTLSGSWEEASVVYTNTGYLGKNGKEVTTNKIDGVFIKPDHHLDILADFGRYDFVVVTDTNTDEINGEFVSVSTAIVFKVIPISKNELHALFRRAGKASVFKGVPGGEAEKISWVRFASEIQKNAEYWVNGGLPQVAMVTDHERDSHKGINSGKTPINGDTYLPDNIKLVYAKADSRKDTLLNKLIRDCDKAAGKLMGELQKHGCTSTDSTFYELTPGTFGNYITHRIKEDPSCFPSGMGISVIDVPEITWGTLSQSRMIPDK